METVAGVLIGLAIVLVLLVVAIFVTVVVRIARGRRELAAKLKDFHKEFGHDSRHKW